MKVDDLLLIMTTEYLILFENMNFKDLMKQSLVDKATFFCFRLDQITHY